MIPLLTIYADLMGVLGGFVVGTLMLNLNSMEYANATVQMVPFKHVLIGGLRHGVWRHRGPGGSTTRGLRCGRSAQAVGRATTTAVVPPLWALSWPHPLLPSSATFCRSEP